MRICGIIAEYNPFHFGHKKHIELSREKTNADIIVCVMSGNFVQRGDPAIFDKWIRTKCALSCGADAVIELPLLYSTQSAEGFGSGGIAVLEAAGADSVCFGSETDDLELLKNTAEILTEETNDYKSSLKEHLDKGLSYPKARMKAAVQGDLEELSMPNAILGVEYLKAIRRSGSKIEPFIIKRTGEGYHSPNIDSELASATAIRKAFSEKKYSEAFGAMPEECSRYINDLIENGLVPVTSDSFNRELFYILRSRGAEYLKILNDVSEGLENRIYKASGTFCSKDDLIKEIKSKRYTYTRISRILLYALLGITKENVEKQNREGVKYLRVLGAKNEEVLSALSRTNKVPLICGSASSPLYSAIDVLASDIYALSQSAKPFCNVKRDLTEKLIIG